MDFLQLAKNGVCAERSSTVLEGGDSSRGKRYFEKFKMYFEPFQEGCLHHFNVPNRVILYGKYFFEAKVPTDVSSFLFFFKHILGNILYLMYLHGIALGNFFFIIHGSF